VPIRGQVGVLLTDAVFVKGCRNDINIIMFSHLTDASLYIPVHTGFTVSLVVAIGLLRTDT
jgi:hydrogenase maturation factor